MSQAPLALAIERSLECRMYARFDFNRPILDLGCGDGLHAKMLLTEKVDVGVDVERRELTRAHQLDGYSDLIRCSASALPQTEGIYNTVFSNSVLEHIKDLETVLNEVFRILAPKGEFYLTVPSNQFDEYTLINQVLVSMRLPTVALRFRRFYNRFWKHYHHYSLEEWRAIARRAGFEIVESHAFDSRKMCLLNDLLVPIGVFSFATKKLINRWTILPHLRLLILYPLYLFLRGLLASEVCGEEGGLVFMALKKR